MADPVGAQNEEANGTAEKTQDRLRTICEPACEAGDRGDQSDSARMGELLYGGTLKPVLLGDQAGGGEEDSAAADACSETTGAGFRAGTSSSLASRGQEVPNRGRVLFLIGARWSG